MPDSDEVTFKVQSFTPTDGPSAGESFPYAVHLPKNYSADKRWPALLFLHGLGERGSDGVKHTTVGLGKAIRENPDRFPCVVIMPQCPDDRRWTGAMEPVVMSILDAAMNEYSIDPDRVVLTGLSMGGFGTWAVGRTYTNRFAALAPICGGGEPFDVGSLAQIPIWCFHGDDDNVVAPDRSREMVAAVQAAGGNIKYTEYPGVNHNSWDPTYGDAEVIAWMLKQHRSASGSQSKE